MPEASMLVEVLIKIQESSLQRLKNPYRKPQNIMSKFLMLN